MDEVKEHLFMSWSRADKVAPTGAMDFFPFAPVLMSTPGSPRGTFTYHQSRAGG